MTLSTRNFPPTTVKMRFIRSSPIKFAVRKVTRSSRVFHREEIGREKKERCSKGEKERESGVGHRERERERGVGGETEVKRCIWLNGHAAPFYIYRIPVAEHDSFGAAISAPFPTTDLFGGEGVVYRRHDGRGGGDASLPFSLCDCRFGGEIAEGARRRDVSRRNLNWTVGCSSFALKTFA